MMVRDFQSVIGKECLTQMPELRRRQPDIIACVGGGRTRRIPHPYLSHEAVSLIGVEAASEGNATVRHSASLLAVRPGVLHGNRTYLLQNADGQIAQRHSVSAGLDYPGVGPEHAWLKDSGRAEYVSITDDEALAAFNEAAASRASSRRSNRSHALACREARADAAARSAAARQPVRAWRQGHGDRRRAFGTQAPLPAGLRSFAAIVNRIDKSIALRAAGRASH
jgi:tryptophan synthase beta chain